MSTSRGDADTRQRLLGSWRLVSWQEYDAAGAMNYPLGPDAVGQLSYDEAGRMSAQLMRRDQPRFANEDWRGGKAGGKGGGGGGDFFYFLTYNIDGKGEAPLHKKAR